MSSYLNSMHDMDVGVQLWPKLAAWFGVEVGPPLKVPLATYMPYHQETWAGIVKKYGLKEYPYEKVRTCRTVIVTWHQYEGNCITLLLTWHFSDYLRTSPPQRAKRGACQARRARYTGTRAVCCSNGPSRAALLSVEMLTGAVVGVHAAGPVRVCRRNLLSNI